MTSPDRTLCRAPHRPSYCQGALGRGRPGPGGFRTQDACQSESGRASGQLSIGPYPFPGQHPISPTQFEFLEHLPGPSRPGHRGCGCCLHTTPGCVHVTAAARMVLGGSGPIGLVHAPSLGPCEGLFEAIGPDKPGPQPEFCLPGLLTPRSSSAQDPGGCPGRSLQRPSEASSPPLPAFCA